MKKNNTTIMTPQEITERFLKAGITVIEVQSPVFQIGKDRWIDSWSLVRNMEHGDLRLAELQTYSEIKTVNARTISVDATLSTGGTMCGTMSPTPSSNPIGRNNSDAELIIPLVDRIIASMNSRYLFVYKFPTVTTLPIHMIDSFLYETARMEHGIDEKIFSLADIKESQLSVVFARVYYDGI